MMGVTYGGAEEVGEAVVRHTSFAGVQCPIARALDRAGEWWSLLILRDAFQGLSRFGEFQRSLGISDNSLTRRLGDLVGKGLLERRAYQDLPTRYEYVLTDAGRDFLPVLVGLATWGQKYDPPERGEVWVADAQTGRTLLPVFVDRGTGDEVTGHGVVIVNTAAKVQGAQPKPGSLGPDPSTIERSHREAGS
ncbi:winged helix-turn-helix transcriptional regulator [Streptomyces sp. NPDC051217]|uniref:winged helix-turn-helix transcriptional regulator n=1 Tax=Streptomyces sp. NPDC051217 TaxID=3365644 RepID=UPI00379715BF